MLSKNSLLKKKFSYFAIAWKILKQQKLRILNICLKEKTTAVFRSQILLSFSRGIFKHHLALMKGSGGLLAISFFQSKATDASQSNEQQKRQAEQKLRLQRLLSEADRLHESGSEASAYRMLRDAIDSPPSGDRASVECADLYWRLARGARAVANSCTATGQADQRRALTYEAFEAAKRGLELEPDNWACHKWLGILLELTGRYEGTKKRIENSYLVRDHFMRAAQAKPDDAVVLHCLGAWCFEVADLPWYQRQLAAAFFAKPPSSSYDEALEYLLRAEQADPNFYSSNLLYIGKAYLRKGDKASARVYLQKTADYKGDTFDDKQSREEAVQLLKTC